ncbi:MAG: ribosome-associated translation inhibitor RaiA [Clostridiales bacterium]|jgi:putative sigma-54 modulation protein|nr:ribosome-associated translation inhibitor RaiA [Clostridiales bacterium]
MRYVFTGKNMNVTEAIKEKTKNKLDRIEKLLPTKTEVEAAVTFTASKRDTKAEVSIPLHKRILRAEVTAEDVASCLDSVVDILEKQIIKYKSRLRERSRRNTATREELSFISEPAAAQEGEGEIVINKTKRFALKPMDAHEAVMEMEMLGHNFYVFRNGKNDEVNVVYKRNDGEYGLIEPTF